MKYLPSIHTIVAVLLVLVADKYTGASTRIVVALGGTPS